MLHFDSSHPIMTRGSRVSSAPPHHTLPASQNFHGMLILKSYFRSTSWRLGRDARSHWPYGISVRKSGRERNIQDRLKIKFVK